MKQLLLIRHARNDWVGDRLAGWTPGVHLNDEGRREAADLAEGLAGYPLDAIFASPLERTMETATALAGPHGLDVRTLEDIGEARYGDWTGQSIKELAKDQLWAGVQFYPSGTRFPGGETLGEVQARAVAALEALHRELPDSVVAAVSHADVIKAVLAHYAGLHLDLFQRLVISPASTSVVRFTPHGPRLVLVNGTGTVPPPPQDKPESGQEEGGPGQAPAPRESHG